ncbi:hypothetical protein [Xenorhabdus sp. TS4]|uniref:hypothetical protein n=1 Tax=Xenorhabdus sp. TS4 TaxID=1873483 RepID=UPI00351C189C
MLTTELCDVAVGPVQISEELTFTFLLGEDELPLIIGEFICGLSCIRNAQCTYAQ